jgi:hypothetical protein
MLEDVTEWKTEELNYETWSLMLDVQRASYDSRFLLQNIMNFQIYP